MRIAVFGGSFDPVHVEHVEVARAAIQSLHLDKIVIMPAAAPPHKRDKTLSPDAHRLEMCRIAFDKVKEAEVSDYEIKQGGVSYTYLTCRYFRETYKDAEIFWLVGTDMLRDFPTWKNPESILSDVTLAVCARAETGEWLKKECAAFEEKFSKKFALVEYNGKDVSSTQIRVLAGAGMRLFPLTDEKTEKYIYQNGLYKIDKAREMLLLEKENRRAHSIRVALTAAKRANDLGVPEEKAIEAALIHDCAKNLEKDSSFLKGFSMPTLYGKVPQAVAHQYEGAYVAEHAFGVQDQDILNAVRYHTSGRPQMSALEKLIFLADMVEEERHYQGVEKIRALFYQTPCKTAVKEESLDECLEEALFQTVAYLKEKQAPVYALTELALRYYQTYNQLKKENEYDENGSK